ncbi:uncharacterized protein LOC106060080 [Biomphalaria glabrata]|uniref:Uncharacterized protein LOC106060080 n=1 Tax=Biomphalaria glabrata TaxID=6526 RepID=A0A9W3AI97_BIOGL|nr:uncharacterized protein LOC106060080 [Biomphalaria glabrata]
MPKLGRRSEFTELDHLKMATLTASTAPYGTNFTPTFSPRIIGSNFVTVLDRPLNIGKHEKVQLISEKPNNLDPRALTDFSRKYNQPYKDPFHNNKWHNNSITNRPDSKDIFSKYPRLAPKEGNRIKNLQMSTVFEPEAWTQSQNGLSEFLPRGMSGSTSSVLANESTGSFNTPSVTNRRELDIPEFRQKLLSQIPRGVVLPTVPIVLSASEEAKLLQILATELDSFHPELLRDIYINISNTVDKHLTGYCHYQDLVRVFYRMSLRFPPDLLQIVAALFVNTLRNQVQVNYEKFLSFVGAALKKNVRENPANMLYIGDGGEVKLFRTVAEQLTSNEFIIDYQKLIGALQSADRSRSNALTANQIKTICFQQRIPIQESLVNSLLQKCEDSRRYDLYNWWAFIKLLQRIQPDSGSISSPKLQSGDKTKRLRSLASSSSRETNKFGYTDTSMWNRDPPISPQKENVPDPNREILSRMDQVLTDFERSYERSKLKLSPRKEELSWFKNFQKFADAIYKHDEKFEGKLPYSNMSEWGKLYNDTFELDIPDNLIHLALKQATKKGQVDIHQFLTLLGKQN